MLIKDFTQWYAHYMVIEENDYFKIPKVTTPRK